MLDIMIIGGGPAGMTAGLYAARMGLKAVVYERLMVGGQASTTNIIENYPGHAQGIGGPELMMEFQQQAESAGREISYDEVSALNLQGDIKTAQTSSGEVQARAAILCMGAQARKLDVPGEELFRGRGVSVLRYVRRRVLSRQARVGRGRRQHCGGGRAVSVWPV